jgi:hypothetical protein
MPKKAGKIFLNRELGIKIYTQVLTIMELE